MVKTWNRIRYRMYVVLFLMSIHLTTIRIKAENPLDYPGFTWSSRPGDVMSMMNTDVTFNWTYTSVPHPVNIAWYYKGTSAHPELTYILGYSDNVPYIPITGLASRVDHTEFPGSAVMILRNVTYGDGGRYESKVAVLDEERLHDVPYISDIASLTVLSESTLRFNISVTGVTFAVSVADNGTEVNLPGHTLTPPSDLDLGVIVSQSAPKPMDILIQTRLGTYVYMDHSCAHSYTCTKKFPFSRVELTMLTGKIQEADVVIVVNFKVQNLGPIRIYGVVKLKDTGYAREIDVDNNSTLDASGNSRSMHIGLVVSNIVWATIVCLILVGIGIRHRKKLQKQTHLNRKQNRDQTSFEPKNLTTSYGISRGTDPDGGPQTPV